MRCVISISRICSPFLGFRHARFVYGIVALSRVRIKAAIGTAGSWHPIWSGMAAQIGGIARVVLIEDRHTSKRTPPNRQGAQAEMITWSARSPAHS